MAHEFTGGAIDLGALAERRKLQEQTDFEPFVTVDETTVELEAFERSRQVPVVLMVGTTRSPDSEELKATFQRLAAGQSAFRVAYVDADATPQVAQLLGVRALPTVVALAAGQPVTSFEGAQPAQQLEQWVAALVSQVGPQLEGLPTDKKEDPRLAQANAALAAGQYDTAASLFDDILADDPANLDAKHAKATLEVVKRLDPTNRETDPVADAAGAPEDVDKQLLAADAEVVAGVPERAFDRLLALVRTEPRAKERLLELFALYEPGDPRVIQARTKLASALF